MYGSNGHGSDSCAPGGGSGGPGVGSDVGPQGPSAQPVAAPTTTTCLFLKLKTTSQRGSANLQTNKIRNNLNNHLMIKSFDQTYLYHLILG